MESRRTIGLRWLRPAVCLALVAGCGAEGPPPPASVASDSGRAAESPAPRSDAAGPSLGTEASFADRGRIEDLLSGLQAVADEHDGIRAAGTPGYDASVELVTARLEELGLEVETPSVEFTAFSDLGSSVTVGGRTFAGPDEARALIYSASGSVTGSVVMLAGSGCDADHFDDVPEGAVAVTLEGGCLRRDQAVNATTAGVAALVVGYPDLGPGEIFRPTLIDPGGVDVPVVSVTGEAVEALRTAASGGEDAQVTAETELAPSAFRNVIAQVGDGSRVVMVGAHLDSVLDGPGLNDNGSGVAAVLEVARGAIAQGVPDGWAVRIGLWGAEEFGTIGSRAYADGLSPDEVVAYLNLDMVGSVNGLTLVYDEQGAAPGSDEITELYQAWLDARGEAHETVDIGGSSDHFGFVVAGIPTGGLFAGAAATGSASNPSANPTGPAPDPCYHIGCDDLSNVDLDRVVLFADATLGVVRQLMRED
jgi:Zn-dependent M28 family amino/carboxypeptidase